MFSGLLSSKMKSELHKHSDQFKQPDLPEKVLDLSANALSLPFCVESCTASGFLLDMLSLLGGVGGGTFLRDGLRVMGPGGVFAEGSASGSVLGRCAGNGFIPDIDFVRVGVTAACEGGCGCC